MMASTIQLSRGQKHAEKLLNGSIALFEQLGIRGRAAEGRIELALLLLPRRSLRHRTFNPNSSSG
jgi:hypothetical protein